ncbi:MAG: tRNA (adenosine(37)-N6)-threonylcarbamoyltransferase complex dimerization subunit type 1 TsaB [Myxococcales bacterium]|nr:tRNA (adenosine(37)-N6)-threonylcarbamoyltransferase complex dimerization subunit type 1 TsaB [Myxococcales bacterium]
MPALAIETSTRTARVALVDARGEMTGEATRTADRHSANLLAMCDELFRAAGLTPRDLRLITCGAGPGSFTGLRVGLAIAKGLALPFGTPLVMISSLEILAHDLAEAAPSSEQLLPLLDAGKGELHAQLFVRRAGALAAEGAAWRLTPPSLVAHLQANPLLVAGGPGADRFTELTNALPASALLSGLAGPRARTLFGRAIEAARRGDLADVARAAPVYGRLPDITQPRQRPP